ncbi:MAG: aspartate dehydrogenase domain-containing protein [Oligoflexales bacterium]
MIKKKIGILGYGKLGQYLVNEFINSPDLSNKVDVCFVWNRTPIPQESLDPRIQDIKHLDEIAGFNPDLIVEVAHPAIIRIWGKQLLELANLFIGSPTVFCDSEFEENLLGIAEEKQRSLICGKGALPGLHELLDLAQFDAIDSLFIQMRKAPESINFLGSLPDNYDTQIEELKKPCILYSGKVRELGKLAPNNVNTMVIAALASGLGLDKVQGELIAAPNLDHHEVYWIAKSKISEGRSPLSLELRKCNPAGIGAVTGQLTYLSFKSSILKALEIREPGLSFC